MSLLETEEKGKKKKKKDKKKKLHDMESSNSSGHFNWEQKSMGPSVDVLFGPTDPYVIVSEKDNCTIASNDIVKIDPILKIIEHKVQKGEWLWDIVRKYFPYMVGNDALIKQKAEQIINFNGIDPVDPIIHPGQILKIPVSQNDQKRNEEQHQKEVDSSITKLNRQKDAQELADAKSHYTPQQLNKDRWKDLPGTIKEAKEVNQLKAKGLDIQAISGMEQTETNIKETLLTQYHKYWHVASHGYGGTDNANAPVAPFFIAAELYDSYKDKTDDNDAGITTSEFEKLPLKEVELVFFSACETAIDRVKETDKNDKHDTLNRSAIKAGAQSSIGTMWTVRDEEAYEFAIAFYDKLLAAGNDKIDIYKTLRATQLDFKNKKNISGSLRYTPKDWGAYQYLNKDINKEAYTLGDHYDLATANISGEDYSEKDEQKRADLATHDPAYATIWNKLKQAENRLAVLSAPDYKVQLEAQITQKETAEYDAKKAAMSLPDLLNQKVSHEFHWVDYDIRNLTDSVITLHIQLVAYEKISGAEVPKEKMMDVEKKLNDKEAVVEIHQVGKEPNFVYFAAIITKNAPSPTIVFINDESKRLDKIIEAQSDHIKDREALPDFKKYDREDELGKKYFLIYNTLWRNVQEKLDELKVEKIYLSTQGHFNNLNITTLYDTVKGKYVIDELEVVTLY
jgi:CHAT domain-containing protein